MEFLAVSAAMGAKELFTYNRDNYKFDQDQSIEREGFRLRMQVLRFQLFREDVRDLVKLTVDRMDIYHLVGALFLQFCVVLFCEGRVQASAPPFLLSLFLLSVASAFVYLLLAVWLSMHASIASHSFGVRLLTRFVRLPIPSVKQIAALKYNFKDFEKQEVTKVLRMPFLQKEQTWSQVNAQAAASSTGAASSSAPPAPPAPLRQPAPSGPATTADLADTGVPAGAPMPHWSETAQLPGLEPARPTAGSAPDDVSLLPQDVQSFVGGEDLLAGPRGAGPERHIQLFRFLQSKWQCYDAYCRVCMSMGINQILQGMSYYCICHTLVENHSPSTGYALIVIFQCTTIGLAVLDLAGMTRHEIIAVQVMGIMPCMLTLWSIAHRKHKTGSLDPEEDYPLSPFSFLCQVAWLELWRRIASPSDDEAKLPRRFRQTLFLDVFHDAGDFDAADRKQADDAIRGVFSDAVDDDGEEDIVIAARAAAAQLALAQSALRRWRAAPEWGLSRQHRKELGRLLAQLGTWASAVQLELARHESVHSISVDSELRPWKDLTDEQKAADPFKNTLVGPFEHDGGASSYVFDVEQERPIFTETDADKARIANRPVLELAGVATAVGELERKARGLLEVRIMRDFRIASRHGGRPPPERQQQRQGADLERSALFGAFGDGLPERCFSVRGRRGAEPLFPNMVSLLRWRPSRRAMGYQRHRDDEDVDAAPSPGRAAVPAGSPAAAGAASAAASAGGGAQSPSSRDPTLAAMAGKNARHFVPERLPWKVVGSMTRAIQAAWLWTAVMLLLKETHIYQVDFQQHPGRRLASEPLAFQDLPVSWPQGSLLRPQGLACAGGGAAVVHTRWALHRAAAAGGAWRLERLGRARLPEAAAVVCAGGPCVAMVPRGRRLQVQSLRRGDWMREVASLRMEGDPWAVVAGAAMPCGRLPGQATAAAESSGAALCLVLAGWDGRALSVASLPLAAGGGVAPVGVVRPYLDVPLDPGDLDAGVAAIAVEARSGRLWVLLADGRGVLAWDLLAPRGVGRWSWSAPAGVELHALCEDAGAAGLLALGRGGGGAPPGAAADARLLRADLPPAFAADAPG